MKRLTCLVILVLVLLGCGKHSETTFTPPTPPTPTRTICYGSYVQSGTNYEVAYSSVNGATTCALQIGSPNAGYDDLLANHASEAACSQINVYGGVEALVVFDSNLTLSVPCQQK